MSPVSLSGPRYWALERVTRYYESKYISNPIERLANFANYEKSVFMIRESIAQVVQDVSDLAKRHIGNSSACYTIIEKPMDAETELLTKCSLEDDFTVFKYLLEISSDLDSKGQIFRDQHEKLDRYDRLLSRITHAIHKGKKSVISQMPKGDMIRVPVPSDVYSLDKDLLMMAPLSPISEEL